MPQPPAQSKLQILTRDSNRLLKISNFIRRLLWVISYRCNDYLRIIDYFEVIDYSLSFLLRVCVNQEPQIKQDALVCPSLLGQVGIGQNGQITLAAMVATISQPKVFSANKE